MGIMDLEVFKGLKVKGVYQVYQVYKEHQDYQG